MRSLSLLGAADTIESFGVFRNLVNIHGNYAGNMPNKRLTRDKYRYTIVNRYRK